MGVEDEIEPVECLSAVTLLTIDMARAVTFYRDLGFRMLYGGPDAAFTSFRVGDGYLNLQLAPNGSPHAVIWGRVVFWVQDVDVMFQRVQNAGFVSLTSPADAPWGERYFHLHDPDGHELSFARPLTSRGAPPLGRVNAVLRFVEAVNNGDIDELAACIHPDFEMVVPQHPARGFRGKDQEVRNMRYLMTKYPEGRIEVQRMAETSSEVWIENTYVSSELEMAAVVIFEIDQETDTVRSGRYYSEPVDRGGPAIDEWMEGLP